MVESNDSKDDSYSLTILTDDNIDIEPIFDFQIYSNILVNIIKNSSPRFTIGLYGEFGAGTTTLMRLVRNQLQENYDNIITVWFNAWKYERQEQFVITAIMKTIAYALPEPQCKNIKSVLLKSITGKHGSRKKESGLIKVGLEDEEEDIEKDSIYYEGLEKIAHEIYHLRRSNPAFRIVLFIEDLDRCSPQKTLEVLESIKIFLGMEGFIYVIGMSPGVVSKLIDIQYKESRVKGEHYLKDLIQVPITLPKRNIEDVALLIEILAKKLDKKNSKIMLENKSLMMEVLDPNPVEIIRFINSFIVTDAIYSRNGSITSNQLLAGKGLQTKWNDFFQRFSLDEQFRYFCIKFIKFSKEERYNAFEELEMKQYLSNSFESKVLKYRNDTNLWSFLKIAQSSLYSIKDWQNFRRIVEA